MPEENSAAGTDGTQRIDKWLWFARALKTRSLASRLVLSGKVRLNGERVSKPSRTVTAGDVLTFTANERVRVLKIVSSGTRRGPFEEARQLYEDLSPEPVPRMSAGGRRGAPAARPKGAGRPTKKQRRDMNDWLSGDD